MAYRVSLPLQHRARGGVVRHCGRRRGGRVRGRRVGGVGGRLRALWVHSLGGHCRGRRSRRVPCTWAACELGRPVPVARCRETAMAAAWACRWPRWHVGAQKRGLLGRPSLGWVTVVRAWGGPVPRRRRARVVPRLAWRGISPQGWSLRTRLWCGAAGRACCGAGASQRVGRPASARMAGTGTGTGAGVGARAQWWTPVCVIMPEWPPRHTRTRWWRHAGHDAAALGCGPLSRIALLAGDGGDLACGAGHGSSCDAVAAAATWCVFFGGEGAEQGQGQGQG